MERVLPRSFLTLLLCLGLVPAWGCGCGEDGPTPLLDTSTDTEDDGGGDATTDGEDAPLDSVPDGDDVIEDTLDDAEDMEEEDGAGTGGGTPFKAETSGGARLTSPNYELELFIAPVRPVGNPSSTNYNLKLGPGGIRSH